MREEDETRDEHGVQVPAEVLAAAREARSVCFVTGAGMSAESGVATFRDPQAGLWSQFRPEDLATPSAWQSDPAVVWAWYLWRFERLRHVAPNAGHLAIGRWAGARPEVSVRVVTQNVDDLHERGGAPSVVHLHGRLSAFRCDTCDRPWNGDVEVVGDLHAGAERLDPPDCEQVGCHGLIRPGVVWFGELLPEGAWTAAEVAVEVADLVVVVGTSGIVYPAAGLPAMARAAGATVVELNPVESAVSDMCHHVWRETAARGLPTLVERVLAGR